MTPLLSNINLHHRILEISYKNFLSHIGSCLTAVDIIDEIYKLKKEDEPFILSSGHAGVALYCILEKYYGLDAKKLFLKHGVHPNKDLKDKIYYSSGSLGHGIGASIGFAITNSDKNVYCLVSDAETYEGSCYESLNFIKKNQINNLKIYVNCNGNSALESIDQNELSNRLLSLYKNIVIKFTSIPYNLEFLWGVSAHYKKLNKNEYERALKSYA